MAVLHKLAKELHKEFWESGALALIRDQTVSLLELVAEVAGQVDHLTCHQGRTIDQNGRAKNGDSCARRQAPPGDGVTPPEFLKGVSPEPHSH
jgi:hypothetical protein